MVCWYLYSAVQYSTVQYRLLVPLVVLHPLHHRVDEGVPPSDRLLVAPPPRQAPDLQPPGLDTLLAQEGEGAVEDCLEADLYNVESTVHSIVQYSEVQYSTAQYSTVQYSTVVT